MVEYILSAFNEFLNLQSALGLLCGSLFGLACGIIPGLSGTTAVVILIPLTFVLDPYVAFITLCSAMGAATVGGSVTSILIGVPGSGLNAATIFDGFPLAKQGRAGLALGAACSASTIGGIFGVLVLAVALPVLRNVVLAIGPPEILVMAIWGMLIIAFITGRDVSNGIIAACIGLMISLVGYNLVLGGERYTFGLTYLWDGFQLGPVFIGLFAISEAIKLTVSGKPITGDNVKIKSVTRQVVDGLVSPLTHWGLTLRSSILGTLIGIVPGIGGVVAAYAAYGQAKQTSKDSHQFGNGDIRGVIAPEASNNAVQGGSLIPTLLFGVPGSATAAVLLGALMIHGINTGPNILKTEMKVIWIIIWAVLISNILGGIIVVLFGNQLVRITYIEPHYLVPIIVCVSLFGAFAYDKNITNIFAALFIGVLGYFCSEAGISTASISIAYVLGKLVEYNFFQTYQMGKGSFNIFFQRPIALTLLFLIVATLIYPFVKKHLFVFKTKYKNA